MRTFLRILLLGLTMSALAACNLGGTVEIPATDVVTVPSETPQATVPVEPSATVTDLPATVSVPPTAILPPTASVGNCQPTFEGNGYVTLSPSTADPVTPNCVSIPVGEITATWGAAPDDFVEVVFWTLSETGNTDVIGVDLNPADGASITWQTYEGQPPMVIYTMVATDPPGQSEDSGYLAFYVTP